MLIRVVSKLFSKRTFCQSLTVLNNNYKVCQKYFSGVSSQIDSKICNKDLHRYVQKLQKEYEELCESGHGEVQKKTRLLELEPIIQILKEREDTERNISGLKELLEDKDTDIKKLAEEEKKHLQDKIEELDEHLKEALIPKDDSDTYKSIVLEVNAGVGGQEAMLFAKELFEMYCNFATYKNWNVEVVDYQTTEIGGIRHASAFISGPFVFRYFKHEAGVHRVQRVPATEKAGRIHTSTVSVTALPQPEEIDVKINSQDLRIETKRASGAGGQHVNTTDSAVRITHLPTGLSVECQVDRSQIKNRQIAMQKLKALLYEKQLTSQVAKAEATKKSQVRSNFRNEKIRTYNFSQDRITDHRLQGCNYHNLEVFLEGGEGLDSLINKLNEAERTEMLLDEVNSVKD